MPVSWGPLGYFGYDPTNNQSAYGTPRVSPYGLLLRATPPMGAIDRFPTFPYRGEQNYHGRQGYVPPVTEAIIAQTQGYTGEAPLFLQPQVDRPEPWTALVASQFEYGG